MSLSNPAAGNCAANLRCEYRVDPVGIDARVPRLSWLMQAAGRSQTQSAYRILVASSRAKLDADTGDLWDSGKVATDSSLHIEYAGKPLDSRAQCWWKVRLWNGEGAELPWSAPAHWEMGLLQPADWKAQWIQAPQHVEQPLPAPAAEGQAAPKPSNDGINRPAHLRSRFEVRGAVKQARLYIAALGLYACSINGTRVGDAVLSPDWTDYAKRVQYSTYDVTALLASGPNAIGAILADGWFSGQVGLTKGSVYGRHPALMAQLIIDYADGTTQTIVTDATWGAALGPMLESDLLAGETYDARLELANWDTPAFNDTAWRRATTRPYAGALEARVSPPVQKLHTLKPISTKSAAPGTSIIDMGQNMVGFVRLKVRGEAGTKIGLRFAEVLNPDGTLYTTNLRAARCRDTYICKGAGEEAWEPTFSFHGFRYVEVTGYPGQLLPDAVTGVVIHSDTPQAGTWECSRPELNQLQHNIVWGQRGNFVSVPTDCPQRDERLGWMGDAQVFIRTATCNADVCAFFENFLTNVIDAQAQDGAYTDVSPRVCCGQGVAAWADAGVICPWTLYEVYGDRRALERQYPSMLRFIEYMRTHSEALIRPAAGYGDWLSIAADTPKDVLATAYFAHSTSLVAKSARVLGKADYAARYEALFSDIKAAFNAKYVAADGRIHGNTQTVYLLALHFGLLDETKQASALRYLVDDIRAKGDHLSTGFVGVSYLLPVLSARGHADLAWKLLHQDTFPSWLFSVKHGATTIWERWDGWTPDKGFQDPGMNSFNHYSLGSCGQWMFTDAAGIDLDPTQPAYKHIHIRPRIGPDTGLSWVKASYDSAHGPIATHWRRQGAALLLDVTIPANTTATVWIPAGPKATVTEGGLPLDRAAGIRDISRQADAIRCRIGSGSYAFKVE